MVVHINKSCKEKKNKDEIEKLKQELELLKSQNNKTLNINKGVINNNNTINIIKFGSEDILKILSPSQQKEIMCCRYLSVEKSIKTIHFNDKFPEYQNIKITNLRSNVAFVHDGKKFNAVNKKQAVSEIVDTHVDAIQEMAGQTTNKIDTKTLEIINQLNTKLNDNCDKKIIDEKSNRTFNNYRDFKVDSVATMIYNEST
jgi:hypothetical protein